MACKGAEQYGDWCSNIDIVWTDPKTGEEYCAFHAPAEHKIINNKRFLTLLATYLHQNRSEHPLNLQGTIFPPEISIRNITIPDCDFSHCTFNSATFSNVVFEGSLVADNAQCMGSMEFTDCHWKQDISLTACTFEDKLALTHSSCNDHIDIDALILPKHLILSDVSVAAIHINSSKTAQAMNVSLDVTNTPDTHIHFSSCNLGMIFIKPQQGCPLSFIDCSIGMISLQTIEHPCVFRECSFNALFLSPVTLPFIQFFSCIFPKSRQGRSVTSDAFPELPLQDEAAEGATSHFALKLSLRTREELYRKLKQQAEHEQEQLFASDWHHAEKFFEEKRLKEDGEHLNALLLSIYRHISEYGDSVGKTSLWLIILLLLPAAAVFVSDFFMHLYTVASTTPEASSPCVSGFGMNIAEDIYCVEHLVWSPFNWLNNIQEALNSGLRYIPFAISAPSSIQDSMHGATRLLQITWQAVILLQGAVLLFTVRRKIQK